ncbi:PglZ domain protein [anaerobic digester metagenome]
MFVNYVFEKAAAQYSERILLIDDDKLEEIMNYSMEFIANGFEVIKYSDDLDFRVQYEDKLKTTEEKLLVIAQADHFIPYDIRKRFRASDISLTKLFPKLNIDVLKEKSAFDFELLCLANQSDFDDLRKRNQTEQYFDLKVYTKENVKKYILTLFNKIMIDIKAVSPIHAELVLNENTAKYKNSFTLSEKKIGYRDWFLIAEEKAKIDVLAAKYDLEFDTSDINRQFKEYVLAQFGKLSQIIDEETPVVISRVMEYAHENSTRFAIVIMDGMSEFDWNIISASFSDIQYQKTAAFAMIPTTTSVSRQCLVSNKYPSQLIEPWKQSKEKAEYTACAKELGFTDEQIGYERGYEAEFRSAVRCGVVIINDVDDLVHAQKQGRLGMFNDITVLANQSKLAKMTKRFLKQGYDVYITSDHGNTPCIGLGKLMGTGVEMETKSRRMLVLKDFADKKKLIEKYGLIDYPKYYLNKDYDYLICDVGVSFDAKGEEVLSHGGITLDEVVVPFIKIKVVQKNG